MTDIAAIIPAAGKSTRMGVPKPLIRWKGRSFLEIIVGHLSDRRIPSFVVYRPDQEVLANLVSDMRERGLSVSGAVNPLSDSEMVDSVSLGIKALSSRNQPWTGILVWPADCPAVDPGDLDRVLTMARQHSDRIVIPTWKGQGGHPTYFPKMVLAPLFHAALPFSKSLRNLMEGTSQPLHVEASGQGVLLNLNDPGAIQELRRLDEDELPGGVIPRRSEI